MDTIRTRIFSAGLDRAENFILLAISISTFVAGAGFWVGVQIGRWQMLLGLLIAFILASIASLKMVVKCITISVICLALCAYCFSYCGIDASVYHVPVQRLLIEGWNPVFQSSIEDVASLTDGECMIYHAAFLPRFVELVGALMAKMTGLYVADTWFHFFGIYLVFAAAFRFARWQWRCGKSAAFVFGFFVAFPSQIGTIIGSAIDYALYSCLAVAVLSCLTWERTHANGDLLQMFVCVAFAMLIKFTGALIGGILLVLIVVRHRKHGWLLGTLVAFGGYLAIVGGAPYLTSWIRYGSPFYPTHTFNSAIDIVDITDDFTSNADGSSMGYFARIVYAWFSTKLASFGCALLQGKETFSPEFYVPVGVDGLKTWFRVLMWMAVAGLVWSKKNRVTFLSLLIFLLMNLAPLKYIGFGRYFMLMWLVPPLALFNLVYNPRNCVKVAMKYAKFGIFVLLGGIGALVVAKTACLYLRAIGIEGARQIVFREAVQKNLFFEADRPMRGFGIKERMSNVDGLEYPDSQDSGVDSVAFDAVLYFPYGLSITPREINKDFPRVDNLRQLWHFRFDKLLATKPTVLWQSDQ